MASSALELSTALFFSAKSISFQVSRRFLPVEEQTSSGIHLSDHLEICRLAIYLYSDWFH